MHNKKVKVDSTLIGCIKFSRQTYYLLWFFLFFARSILVGFKM